MPAKKYSTDEERREARRDSARRYRERNPDCQREYKAANREAVNERQRLYRTRRPDVVARDNSRRAPKKREKYLVNSYGITLDEYNLLAASQGHRCRVCEKKRKLCVDHCHETGEIRGLLCRQCNAGIGQLGDNVEGLTRALNYLKEAEKCQISKPHQSV